VVGRVGNLIAFLPELEFDPFDDNMAAEWRASMARFWEKVEAIEKEAVHFIDASFKRLRSAEVSHVAMAAAFSPHHSRCTTHKRCLPSNHPRSGRV
jgi:hypothetical protein